MEVHLLTTSQDEHSLLISSTPNRHVTIMSMVPWSKSFRYISLCLQVTFLSLWLVKKISKSLVKLCKVGKTFSFVVCCLRFKNAFHNWTSLLCSQFCLFILKCLRTYRQRYSRQPAMVGEKSSSLRILQKRLWQVGKFSFDEIIY